MLHITGDSAFLFFFVLSVNIKSYQTLELQELILDIKENISWSRESFNWTWYYWSFIYQHHLHSKVTKADIVPVKRKGELSRSIYTQRVRLPLVIWTVYIERTWRVRRVKLGSLCRWLAESMDLFHALHGNSWMPLCECSLVFIGQCISRVSSHVHVSYCM